MRALFVRGGLPCLRHLSLIYEQTEDELLEEFQGDDSPTITTEILSQLADSHPQLLQLCIAGDVSWLTSSIDNSSARVIASMAELERLELSCRTNIGDHGFRRLVTGLPCLETLELKTSALTDAALIWLAKRPRLQVRGSAWTWI